MKALIRHPDELIREMDGIDGIDWTTGAPNTNKSWCGGPYVLAEDCPPDAIAEDFDIINHETETGQFDEEGAPITFMLKRAYLNTERYNQRKSQETIQ